MLVNSAEADLDTISHHSASETICLQCGDSGFTNAFVYCVKCLKYAVHRYCLYEMPKSANEFARWVCDDCDREAQNQPVQAFECNMEGNPGVEHPNFEDVLNFKQASNVDKTPAWIRLDTRGMNPKINLNFRLKIIRLILKTLTAVGGVGLVERFRQGCFGRYLGWADVKSTVTQGLFELLTFEIKSLNQNQLWFRIGNRDICFSASEYALITGLSFGSSSFDPMEDHDARVSGIYHRVCGGKLLKASELLAIFENKSIAMSQHDDYLSIANILMLWYFVLGYASHRKLEPWIFVLVDDFDSWDRFPWGAYSYAALVHYIGHIPNTRVNLGPTLNLSGPIWALQIWAYEAILTLGELCGRVVSPDLLPRLLRWRFKKPKSMDWFTFFTRQLDCASALTPHQIELRSMYWMSTQTTCVNRVNYKAAENPIRKASTIGYRRATLKMTPNVDLGLHMKEVHVGLEGNLDVERDTFTEVHVGLSGNSKIQPNIEVQPERSSHSHTHIETPASSSSAGSGQSERRLERWMLDHIKTVVQDTVREVWYAELFPQMKDDMMGLLASLGASRQWRDVGAISSSTEPSRHCWHGREEARNESPHSSRHSVGYVSGGGGPQKLGLWGSDWG